MRTSLRFFALYLGIKEVRRTAGLLEVLDIGAQRAECRRRRNRSLSSSGTSPHRQKFKEVVLTEELIAHIQIADNIDDVLEVDLFRPNVAERLAAKVNTVALLIQELRLLSHTGDASRHRKEKEYPVITRCPVGLSTGTACRRPRLTTVPSK